MPKNHYERWTEEEIDEVFVLLASGVKHADIAKVFGRSKSSITNMVHRERRKHAGKIKPVQVDKVPTLLERIKRWLGISI